MKTNHYKWLSGLLLLFFPVLLMAQELSGSTPVDKIKYDESTELGTGFGLGIGVKMSTFGPGVELIGAFSDKLHLRLGFNSMGIKYTYSDTDLEVKASAEVRLQDVSLLLNYQLARVLFISGGFIYNNNEIKLIGFPTGSIIIGDITAGPDDGSTLTARIRPGSSINPYAGIGIGRSLSKNGVVSFAFEVGAAFQGSPTVELFGTGNLNDIGTEENRQLLEENVAFYTIHPVVSLQLSFRFL